ncbi:MAG: pentapeptide repeat-containing protein [Candidatus Accumulibacter sp.]|jgi:uncharacterized protein YjbI with pentapeptide repeats|nr:pentapeptide repeat-containing protein [Accumulibacter sp.]
MNIEPTEFLYCVAQPFALKGNLHQSLTVGLGFDLMTRQVIPAARALGAAMQALPPGECLDMGLPKREAEWLMAASAFAPQGKTVTSLLARVRVGTSERDFLLTGGTDASGKPQTFTSLPLVWSETFGAPDHPENPLGCGLVPDAGSGRVRAPRLVDVRDAHGHPACPGAMGAWPARMRNMGSYDAHWRKTRCPDLPDDCDLSYINLAQRAQRLPELKGDETVFLSGFDAEHPEIQTRLPGKTLWVFVRRAEKNEEERLLLPYDTLWLFPNSLVGLLLGHLLLPCADSAASDIATVRFEMTPPDPAEIAPPPPPPPVAVDEVPPPAEGASAQAVAASAALAAGAALAVDAPGGDAPAVSPPPPPTAPPPPPVEAASAPSAAADVAKMQADAIGELHRSLPEINAALTQAGLPPMTPEQVAATEAQIVAQTTKMQEIMQQVEAAPEPDLHDTLRQAGVSEEMIRGVDAVMEMTPPNPADYADAASWQVAVDTYLAGFERHLPLSDGARATQRQTLMMMGPGGDALLDEMAGPTPTLTEALTKAGLAPEQAALLSSEIDRMPSFDSLPELKAHLAGMEQRVGFPAGSMTGVVDAVQNAAAQAGLTLEPPVAASVPGLESAGGNAATTASLLATNVAVPAATLNAATSISAAAPEAAKDIPAMAPEAATSISAAAPEAVKDIPAMAPDAVAAPVPAPPPGSAVEGGGLHYAYQALDGHDFSGKVLDGADFTHASLKGANFSGASLKNADFDEADCEQADFTRAALDHASFRKTRCRQAYFTNAAAPGARFVGTDLSAARMTDLAAARAELDGAALADAVLSGAAFKGALLRNLSAAGLAADHADFSDAHCMGCDFSGANFKGASWQAAQISGTRFDQADFRAANLSETTLMGGASLTDAHFPGANLKGGDWRAVDARRSRFDDCDARETNFIGCQLDGSRWPRAKAQGADFSRSGLAGADFSGANLMRASLRECLVAKTNFSASNLYGADLYRTDMTLANVDGALLENTLMSGK